MLKNTPFAVPLIYLKGKFTKPKAQNEEAEILNAILHEHDVPKTFVEFGFGGWEFNCAALAYEWDGLLIDGDGYNVRIARTILPRRVKAERRWLTLENLQVIRDFASARPIGVLSIDVDGNDYWFLKALIDIKPKILICEYNSVLGLAPITIPYDPLFDRMNYGNGWYFGASLAALAKLASKHDYALVAQTSGVNAFFVRGVQNDVDPVDVYQARHTDKWDEIKHLPFVSV